MPPAVRGERQPAGFVLRSDKPGPLRIAIRAPDHLGDAVMALPVVEAISSAYPNTRVATRGRWGRELFGNLCVPNPDVPPEADVGVFLKPSLAAVARWRGLPRRIGIGYRPWLTEALPARDEHRREGFLRIAKALGVEVGASKPQFKGWGRSAVESGAYIALNPWSPTPTVRWPRFVGLAAELQRQGHRVVFFAGPGEEAAVREVAGTFQVVGGLSLPDFAATLSECCVFVSNDSGAAHFAASCGTPVLMMHGSTAAERTGVGHAIDAGPLWCRPCYGKSCWWEMPCLKGISVDAVLKSVNTILASAPPAGSPP